MGCCVAQKASPVLLQSHALPPVLERECHGEMPLLNPWFPMQMKVLQAIPAVSVSGRWMVSCSAQQLPTSSWRPHIASSVAWGMLAMTPSHFACCCPSGEGATRGPSGGQLLDDTQHPTQRVNSTGVAWLAHCRPPAAQHMLHSQS